jgi:hypothetical protein
MAGGGRRHACYTARIKHVSICSWWWPVDGELQKRKVN